MKRVKSNLSKPFDKKAAMRLADGGYVGDYASRPVGGTQHWSGRGGSADGFVAWSPGAYKDEPSLRAQPAATPRTEAPKPPSPSNVVSGHSTTAPQAFGNVSSGSSSTMPVHIPPANYSAAAKTAPPMPTGPAHSAGLGVEEAPPVAYTPYMPPTLKHSAGLDVEEALPLPPSGLPSPAPESPVGLAQRFGMSFPLDAPPAPIYDELGVLDAGSGASPPPDLGAPAPSGAAPGMGVPPPTRPGPQGRLRALAGPSRRPSNRPNWLALADDFVHPTRPVRRATVGVRGAEGGATEDLKAGGRPDPKVKSLAEAMRQGELHYGPGEVTKGPEMPPGKDGTHALLKKNEYVVSEDMLEEMGGGDRNAAVKALDDLKERATGLRDNQPTMHDGVPGYANGKSPSPILDRFGDPIKPTPVTMQPPPSGFTGPPQEVGLKANAGQVFDQYRAGKPAGYVPTGPGGAVPVDNFPKPGIGTGPVPTGPGVAPPPAPPPAPVPHEGARNLGRAAGAAVRNFGKGALTFRGATPVAVAAAASDSFGRDTDAYRARFGLPPSDINTTLLDDVGMRFAGVGTDAAAGIGDMVTTPVNAAAKFMGLSDQAIKPFREIMQESDNKYSPAQGRSLAGTIYDAATGGGTPKPSRGAGRAGDEIDKGSNDASTDGVGLGSGFVGPEPLPAGFRQVEDSGIYRKDEAGKSPYFTNVPYDKDKTTIGTIPKGGVGAAMGLRNPDEAVSAALAAASARGDHDAVRDFYQKGGGTFRGRTREMDDEAALTAELMRTRGGQRKLADYQGLRDQTAATRERTTSMALTAAMKASQDQNNEDRKHIEQVRKTDSEIAKASREAGESDEKRLHSRVTNILPPVKGPDGKPVPDTAGAAALMAKATAEHARRTELMRAEASTDPKKRALLKQYEAGIGALDTEDLMDLVASVYTSDISARSDRWGSKHVDSPYPIQPKSLVRKQHWFMPNELVGADGLRINEADVLRPGNTLGFGGTPNTLAQRLIKEEARK